MRSLVVSIIITSPILGFLHERVKNSGEASQEVIGAAGTDEPEAAT